jgi:hypothetical protein
MANFNSIPALLRESPRDLQESLGITQFSGENEWVHIMNGLIFQGGIVTRSGETDIVVPFNVSYPKQVLGIFINPAIFIITPTLTQFTVQVSAGTDVQFYWFAIGI